MVGPWTACIQVIWVIWDVFSLKQDVKLPLCWAKASPQLPVTGKPPPQADNSMPVFKSQGLAHWTLDCSGDNSYTLFQPGSSGKGWCWLQITGVSDQPSHAASDRTLEQTLNQGTAGLFELGTHAGRGKQDHGSSPVQTLPVSIHRSGCFLRDMLLCLHQIFSYCLILVSVAEGIS